MEAKDTVMSDAQLDEIGYLILPIGDRTGSRRVAEAQAEISFKAGVWEVVEWIRLHLMTKTFELDATYQILITGREWQAKLKELGIEK